MAKVIEALSIAVMKREHSQPFEGHGISGTKWTDCATGVGNSYFEAINDALESLGHNDWGISDVDVPGSTLREMLDREIRLWCGKDRDYDRLEADAEDDAKDLHSECVIDPETNCDDCELHYFVSIDVR